MFCVVMRRLEESPLCQRLPFTSFMLLPFQRITRIKILIQVHPPQHTKFFFSTVSLSCRRFIKIIKSPAKCFVLFYDGINLKYSPVGSDFILIQEFSIAQRGFIALEFVPFQVPLDGELHRVMILKSRFAPVFCFLEHSEADG